MSELSAFDLLTVIVGLQPQSRQRVRTTLFALGAVSKEVSLVPVCASFAVNTMSL